MASISPASSAKIGPAGSTVRALPPTLARLMERGQALERHGKRDEARQLYERALADDDAAEPSWTAQLLRQVARTYVQDSNYPAAEETAQAALRKTEEAADEASRGHALNMLAVIRWSQGDIDAAERLYVQSLESAQLSGESRLSAMVATNLGVMATVRGDHARALDCHQSALSHARFAGAVEEAMRALNNLGMLHTQMGRFDEAGRAYEEALEIGHVIGNLSMCILAQLNVARLRVAQGDYPAASVACDEGMALAARIGDPQADGEAAHLYGVIARAGGDVGGAEGHFLRAETIAAQRRDLILEAETSRELAGLYRSQGRNRETLQRLNQSHRLFAQLQARRELADVDRRVTDLEADFLEVVRKWGDSIESKDRYTQGHCVRVADLACALWSNVNGPDTTSLFWFRIGALLHDVGKLMIPAEVLNKAGKLSADEWALVQRHPSAGVELLAEIDFPWDVRPIVESHHERWDGGGYPHGLVGEAIPLTARVLCIADVYDALTSERSYKTALTQDEAMDIMRRDVGRQFDPALFARFEEIVIQ